MAYKLIEGINMKKVILALVLAAVFVSTAKVASAMQDRPYTNGPVSDVAFIKTKPGMFDDYMKWIATTWKATMEEGKKEGFITSYSVFSVEPRNPGDPDLIITISYPNMAALDGINDKMDAVAEKVEGSVAQSNANAIDREKLRTVLGSELIQELVLK
jgi:hypothetical protein